MSVGWSDMIANTCDKVKLERTGSMGYDILILDNRKDSSE